MITLREITGMVAVMVVAIASSQAAIKMTFEGLEDNEQVHEFYNGGAGGNGTLGTENFHISFGGNAWALISTQKGGSYANFSNNPSGDTIALFCFGEPIVMMMDPATDGFYSMSFYYASPYGGTVSLYSDLNADALVTVELPESGLNGESLDSWVQIFVPAFVGPAYYGVFNGMATAFDDITLTDSPNAGPNVGVSVPEPISLVVWSALAGASASVVVARKRRHRATRPRWTNESREAILSALEIRIHN